MKKPTNVTSRQIRQALLTLYQAGFEGRGNSDCIPDAVADLSRMFGLSMYHAHMADCYEVSALDVADLHIAKMTKVKFCGQAN